VLKHRGSPVLAVVVCAVANAAGGFAGMNKVSAEEKSVLDQLEAALRD